MSTHTPGPWRIAPPSAYPKSGGLNIDAGENGTGGYVCLVGSPDDVYAKADARLIAAAPDMLAALKAYLPFDERIRAIVAKAEAQP